MRYPIAGLIALCLASCTAPSQSALQRAAAPPPPGPQGILSSAPPADSSFYPLRCLPDGPDTFCKRDTN